MNLQQLAYVVEISRCGSINKAARKLFVSQSSVSAAIQGLEQELGILLFRRSNRGVEFTRAGREFLSYASALIKQKEHIESVFTGRRSEAPAYLSVSSQRYPFSEDAFIRFIHKTERPSFRFSLKEASMDTVIEDVYDHRSDVGVIFLSNTTQKYIRHLLLAKGIEFHEMMALQPCVFVRRGHPLTAKNSVSAEDLLGYMYISFEHGESMAMDFSEEYHLLSYEKPPRVIQVNDRATAVNVIASTDAITTGSGLLVEGLMDTRMISLPLEDTGLMRLGWIKAKTHRLSNYTQEFLLLLEQSLAQSVDYTERVRRELTGTGKVGS